MHSRMRSGSPWCLGRGIRGLLTKVAQQHFSMRAPQIERAMTEREAADGYSAGRPFPGGQRGAL